VGANYPVFRATVADFEYIGTSVAFQIWLSPPVVLKMINEQEPHDRDEKATCHEAVKLCTFIEQSRSCVQQGTVQQNLCCFCQFISYV
jgi:hypothetical protein